MEIRAIVSRLNVKPTARLEAGSFVAYLDGEWHVLGKISSGLVPALQRMREVCGRERLATGQASRKEIAVSYSLEESECPVACKCKYNEDHHTMDREDCYIRCDSGDAGSSLELPVALKKTDGNLRTRSGKCGMTTSLHMNR